MKTPPELARNPAVDAAARAVLETLGALDRAAALARLEGVYRETAAGVTRRALVAARVALLRGAPLLVPPPPVEAAPEPPPPLEPPAPPPPRPVVIPAFDMAAMMSLLDDFDVPEEAAATPEPVPEPQPEPEADGGWTRIRLTEDGPRGPGQFPKGAALSVTLEDAARLLMAGIAEELEPLPEEEQDSSRGRPGDREDAPGTDDRPRFAVSFPDAEEVASDSPRFVVQFPDDPDEVHDGAPARPEPFGVTVQDRTGEIDDRLPGPRNPFRVAFPDDMDEAREAPFAPREPFRVTFPDEAEDPPADPGLSSAAFAVNFGTSPEPAGTSGVGRPFQVAFPDDPDETPPYEGPSPPPAPFQVVFPDGFGTPSNGADAAQGTSGPAQPFRVVFPDGFGEGADYSGTEEVAASPDAKAKKPRAKRARKPPASAD